LEGKKIILLSCGIFEKKLTAKVVKEVSRELSHPVELRECALDMSRFYNPGRRQYNADELLEVITRQAPRSDFRVMGLVRVDLYIPILTYIFGQATLNGRTGVVSLYRLRNEHYGLEPDEGLLIDRFGKVVIHELGHTFGLIHCRNPVCVMRSSTYVEDLDQKSSSYCHRCRAELNRIEQLDQ